MAKIKFTKTELKRQQDAKKQFERFLPTLQLKKQQLQMEVKRVADLVELNEAGRRELEQTLEGTLSFFDDESAAAEVAGLVVVENVKLGSSNVAGVNIPVYEGVIFREIHPDYLNTEWFIDEASDAFRRAIELGEERKVLLEQKELLSRELASTSQRVNLFEKVKLPECKDNIRRIGIMLGDMQTSAVVRSKIAKKKSAETSAR